MTLAPLKQARRGFDIDLLDGQANEDALVRHLLDTRVEVKFDDWCCGRNGRRATGNIALEYEQRCRDGVVRPSGIHPESTQAEILAINYDDEQWLWLPMATAQEYARRAIRDGRERWLGDGNNHHNALVPAVWFVQGPPADLEAVA